MNLTNLFKSIVEESNDLIWAINAEYRLVYANQAYLQLMQEVTGKETKILDPVFEEGFGKGYVEKWKNYYSRAIQGESFVVLENFQKPGSGIVEFNQVSFRPILKDNGKLKFVLCQSKDVTELESRRSQADRLLSSSIDVFCTIDPAGKFVYVSAASKKHWGYLPHEMMGEFYAEFIVEEDRPKTQKIAEEITSGKEVRTFINRYRRKDGSIAHNIWSASFDPTTQLMYCVAKDWAEQIEKSELIKQSEQRFKSLVQEGSDLIAILNEEGIYTYVSPTSLPILGIAPETFIGRSPFEFIHPEDKERALENLKEVSTNQKVRVSPFRFKNEQGEWRWIETVLTNMLENPAINGIVANSRDITDKIEEENRLKLFEKIINSTSDAIMLTEAEPLDKPGPKIVFVNEAFTQMTGYSKEEVIGKNPRLLQGPKSDPMELKALGEKLRKWKSTELTVLNYKKNGDEFWVNFAVSPIADNLGWYTHWISIQRDVTEQKNHELEQNLIARISVIFNEENELEALFAKLCMLIASFGDFDLVEFWTPNITQSAMKLFSQYFLNPSDANLFTKPGENVSEMRKGQGLTGKVWEKKSRIYWSNVGQHEGFLRQEEARKMGLGTVLGIPLIFDKKVNGVLLIGSKLDNLDKHASVFKQLETFLGSEINRKKLEIDLTRLINSVPELVSIGDFDGRFLQINKAGIEILGYPEHEIMFQGFEKFIHPDDLEIASREFSKLRSGEKIVNLNLRFLTKAGSIVWLNWTCSPDHKEGLIYCTAKNLTEEMRLRELTKSVEALARIGSWEIDLENKTVYWSDMVHQIHETDPSTFQPTFENTLDFFREDFKELVFNHINECFLLGVDKDFEAVIVTKNNRETWVRIQGKGEFINEKCKRVYGSLQDIHHAKILSLRIRDILDSISDSFFALDKDWNFTYFNSEAEKVFGLKEQEVIGKHIQEVFPKQENEQLYGVFDKVFHTKNSESFEYWDENFELWYEVNVYPTDDGLSAYFKDITLRKMADIRLTKANDRFIKVTEATNDAIWDWDIVNNVYFRSEAISRFFGKQTNKYLTQNEFWKDKFHAEDLPKIKKSVQEALDDPNCHRWEMEYRVLKEDGEIGYVLDRGIISRNSEGQAIRMVGAMTDLTEQKRMTLLLDDLNKDLLRYTQELERSNEELEQFAFVASHDLQEPLRMITSFMDLLKRRYETQLDDTAKKYIFFATDGAKRMRKIILDLLDFSRAKKQLEEYESVDLNEVVAQYLLLRRKLISEKEATIQSQKLPVLYTYKAAIIQVFHCLLDNALKYSKDEVTPYIEISVQEKDAEWKFSIADNGIGIDEKFHQKIFILFQRLHGRDSQSGTGVGLSIAKRHVELLGGSIGLDSSPGVGSVFHFTIPKSKTSSK